MPGKSGRTTRAAAARLTRREREIMDVVYRLGGATARQIRDELHEPPHPAAVRTLLRILESKGELQHVKDGPRHVYVPTTPRSEAQRSALGHLLNTFFNGSRAAAVAALLDDRDRPLTPDERDELTTVVRRLRSEGR
jgi:predicted transcriptional regulator